MKKLDVTRQDHDTLSEAIDFWETRGYLDPQKSAELRDSLDVKSFDWGRLARYAFWVALGCLVFAILSLFIDEAFVQFVQSLSDAPDVIYFGFFAALAVIFYALGFRYKLRHPTKTLSIETMMLVGVFATAASIGFLGKILGKDTSHYSLFFLLSVVIYGVLAVRFKSQLIWIFMLISLGIWFGTETAHHSNWGFKFWGMNYPLRFTLFGLVITLIAIFVVPRVKALLEFRKTSYVVGLMYLMISLWALSIFGNYSDWDRWASIRQYEMFYWGLISTAVALGLVLYGLRFKDNTTREIGFVFFIINIYTRYVEYLWDNMNRTLFFLFLAVSFWLVGRWAEKIWNKRNLD
ncbi:DUF2157 domain-containing protein [Sphingobacterium corticibacter]|uniref:DUF2157 domain-containing protein n=1 Tax=Sphingobacterium corticibacter TaxID=2171749 RepID=A0A2T8HH86_9SPHI|nr:DUF2157 domain-containing protein [Sphingobacterium corticibacter]PVH24775.1 DUF2157 domain-containing protein [Sphingobacterium corticibacter]